MTGVQTCALPIYERGVGRDDRRHLRLEEPAGRRDQEQHLARRQFARPCDALPDDQKARFRILLVSVDPARDTPGRLNEYASYFGKEGVGVHVPEPQLANVAQAYGVGYQKADIQGADYQINHTTATYLVDSAGYPRAAGDVPLVFVAHDVSPVAPGAVLLALQQPPLAADLAPVRVELQTTYRNDGAIARVSEIGRAHV